MTARRALLCLLLTACPKPAASPGPSWGPTLGACCYGDPDTNADDTASPLPLEPRPWHPWHPWGQGDDTGSLDTAGPTDTADTGSAP